jgi:serine/threonine protein kinase
VSRTSPEATGPPELAGYRFIRHIGAGGNAQVYLYEQELPSRKVAVKVLNESALSDAARRRFTAEANVTAVLAHQHIVQVFEAKVTADGRPYIVMPFYPQPNLSVRTRRAHFSVGDVLRIGIQIGSAVETSHRHDVLHRDIKPQNILTDSYGQVALTDFGIATTKPGDGPEGLSVPWSPPEILYGTGPGDQRSDVYSLGATLWHLLVGRPPFEQPDGGDTTGQLVERIGSDPPPRTQRADVPNSLERLLRQTMAKDPAARPQSAMELIRGLQSIEQELRLPVTHPILPADEPARGDTRGDTVARPIQQAQSATAEPAKPEPAVAEPAVAEPVAAQPVAAQPTVPEPATAEPAVPEPVVETPAKPPWDESAWSGETQDATIARASRPAPMQPAPLQPAPVQPASVRSAPIQPSPIQPIPMQSAPIQPAPVRPAPIQPAPIQPSPIRRAPIAPVVAAGQTRQTREPAATTHARMPVILDPSGGAAAPTRGIQELRVTKDRPRRSRVLAFAGGGALLVVVAVVAVLVLPRGSDGQPGTSQATKSSGQSAFGPGAAAPGQPVVTVSRANAKQVEFRWTYANPASSDKFRVQVSGGTGVLVEFVTKPELLRTVANGHRTCIAVTVSSADGQASPSSSSVCWPN